ncbi:MAG: monoamine oxidase [Ilumatobacter sp.]|jgi:monoamine oxidase
MTIDRRQFIAAMSATAMAAACSSDDALDTRVTEATTPPGSAVPVPAADELVSLQAIEAAVEASGAPAASIPSPSAAIITRWRQDPFARGSYSYLAAAARPADRDALRADVDSRLFFAGEATSLDFAATVHGALLEGRAAADRVADEADDGDTVAIIGAGIAGLAAARQLTDQGYDVVVLEGRDRIGGRIHTDESFGFPYDLGAAWVHGDDGNPLVDLIEQAGIDTMIFDADDLVVYDGGGDEVGEADIDAVFALLEDLDLDDTRTLATILDDELDDADDATRSLVRYAAISAIEHDESGSLADLTPASIDSGEEIGGNELIFPGGYAQILKPLTTGVAIEVGYVVNTIAYHREGVVISLEGRDHITADRVVVTVPLGVLKAGDISFEPVLPEAKRTAIQRLGMGVLDRVVLRFEEKFWEDTAIIGYVNDQEGLFIEWYDMTNIVGAPVLVGFNAADVADELATRTDEQILEAAMRTLITIYGS